LVQIPNYQDKYKKGDIRHKSKRFETDAYKGSEIQAEIDKGNILKILYDSNE